jgi:YVTN family beta-propeller protein
VTATGSNTAFRIDPRTGKTRQRVAVGRSPIDPDLSGADLWVPNNGEATLSRVDTATGDVVETVPVGQLPSVVAVIDGDVWVACYGSNEVWRLRVR